MATIGFVEPISPPSLARTDRQYGDGGKSDQRTAGQRDRDRVLYASAFRRLGGVTQVVMAVDEGYAFHNRLTHSVKVAQVARRLAEKILHETVDRPDLTAAVERLGGLDPDVVEAAALAHDLGHPPFGHIGEQELDVLTRRWDPDGFEGNAQSFRILCRLAQSGAGLYPGLNLSRATLAAVLKYPWRRPEGQTGSPPPKFGVYEEDESAFEFAFERLDPSLRVERTLEAQIMDWADDITYAVHDVEDFFRARWTPLDRLSRDFVAPAKRGEEWIVSDEIRSLFEGVRASWYSKADGNPPPDPELEEAAKVPLAAFPISHPYTGTDRDRQDLRSWSSLLIGRFIQSTELDTSGLVRPRHIRVEVALLKRLTRDYVIGSSVLGSHQHGQRLVLRRLFVMYMASLRKGNADVLPPRVRDSVGDATTEGKQARFVCDVLSSMSELAVLHAHGRLTGTALGPLEDPAII